MLPFTRNDFLAVFAEYNAAVWPLQLFAWGAGSAMLLAILRPTPRRDRIVALGLGLMWLWTGAVYHALYFAPINPVALLFGVLFVAQAALLLRAAWRGHLHFGLLRSAPAWLGGVLVLYGLVLYPIAGLLAGHAYPAMPMFGITPCPVVLFTVGLLLLTTSPVPMSLLVIPFLWSLIGGSAAWVLDMPQDWMLLVSGLALPVLGMRDAHRMRNTAATGSPSASTQN